MIQSTVQINGAFRGQAVTGQQRYATEISNRLLESGRIDCREVSPPALSAGSKFLAWAWALGLGFRGRRTRGHLLTLTFRGPIAARHHIVVIHDLFVLDHPEWFSLRYVITHAPVLRLQIRTAELLIAVSQPVADVLRSRFGDRRIIVAPNAPAHVFTRLPDRSFTAETLGELGLVAKKYILAVGSRDPRKNAHALIQAHAELPESMRREFPLVFVGSANESIFGNSKSRPELNIIRVGYVSDEVLTVLYSEAQLVVFPSLDEGFGLPAIEALACGADVLVSDIPVLRWVCGRYAEYFSLSDGQSLTLTIRRLVEFPSESSGTRAERRKYAVEMFSWSSSSELIIDAISGLKRP